MDFENLEGPKKEQAAQPAPSNFSFDLSQAPAEGSIIITVAGDKGGGKTNFCLNERFFPGKIDVISFDRKSAIVKKYSYKNDERITVYDGIRYLDPSPQMYTETAALTIEYIKAILHRIQETKTDWVVIDGLTEFASISEQCMRHIHGIECFSGISNKNLWKTRRVIMRGVHILATRIATKGVLYTTYTERDDDVREGDIFNSKKVPKWTDVVLSESDCEIYVYQKQTPTENTKFFAKIVSSKVPMFRTGDLIDVTRDE